MLTGLGTIDVTIGVGVTAVVDGYTLGNNAALVDLGTVTDDGPFVFGYYLGDETLTIATGGVFEMVAGGTIFEPTGNSSSIINDGLFEAAGAAFSKVAVPFINLAGGTLGSGTAGLELLEGGTIGGRLEGPGEIDLGGGGFTLFASAVGALDTLAIGSAGTSAVVILAGDLTVGNELELVGGATLATNAYLYSAALVNDNLLLATGSGASVIDISFTNGNTATIDSNIGTLQFENGGILAGTLGGSGVIDLVAGNYLLLPDALVDVSTLEVSYPGNPQAYAPDLTLDANLTIGHELALSDRGTIDLNGYDIDVGGTFATSEGVYGGGVIYGDGTIDLSGGADISGVEIDGESTINFSGKTGALDVYFVTGDDVLSIASSSTWSTGGIYGNGALVDSVINAGELLQTTTGTISIRSDFTQTGSGMIDIMHGTIALNSQQQNAQPSYSDGTLAGTIEGKGELWLGDDVLLASKVSVATLGIGDVTLGADLTYAGMFIDDFGNAQGVFDLGGYTLDLSGDAVISGGYVFGPGRLEISGSVSAQADVSAPVFIKGGTLNTTYSSFSDGITFDGKGELIIGSTVMPTTTISGFAAGDEIQLAGVKYHAGAKVKVKEAGVVEIIDGGATYSLNIAGATVGDTDFSFGKGSVLTTSAKAKMEFLRPENSGVAAASDDVAVAPVAGAVAGASATIAAVGGGLGHELLALVRAAMDVPVGYGNFG